MIQGHELTNPIQYGYLLLGAAIILIACIAGIIYILREIRSTATDAPDYHAYWKSMATDNIPNHPISQWIWAKQMKELAAEVNEELSSRWMKLKNTVKPEKTCRITIPAEKANGKSIQMALSTDVVINVVWPKTKESFSWHGFLLDAKYGQPSQEQIDKAKILSASWHTCPCSQLDSRIPRKDSGEPKDHVLARLGADFWVAMLMDQYPEAYGIHHQIITHEATLLNQIKQVPKPIANGQKPINLNQYQP